MNQINDVSNEENILQCVDIAQDILSIVKKDIIIDKIQRMAEALLEKENKILEEQE